MKNSISMRQKSGRRFMSLSVAIITHANIFISPPFLDNAQYYILHNTTCNTYIFFFLCITLVIVYRQMKFSNSDSFSNHTILSGCD